MKTLEWIIPCDYADKILKAYSDVALDKTIFPILWGKDRPIGSTSGRIIDVQTHLTSEGKRCWKYIVEIALFDDIEDDIERPQITKSHYRELPNGEFSLDWLMITEAL